MKKKIIKNIPLWHRKCSVLNPSMDGRDIATMWNKNSDGANFQMHLILFMDRLSMDKFSRVGAKETNYF